ncbi:MAG: hypothetical protein QM730_15270 [Anaerolineales bacterium]
MSNNQIHPNLVLRFSPTDKAALVELSQRLDLNQTETLRVLVRETLAILKERDARPSSTAALKTRDLKPASPDEATEISPKLRRRIEREVQAAKSGDLLARIWLQKNARWVTAYALQTQKRK